MSGKLIVIEGLDGSGKATQTKLLFEALLKVNADVKKISFPDYSSYSSDLVKRYLSGNIGDNSKDVNAYAASTFYAIDRYISYIESWKKYYDNGAVIIADRYTTSNQIYHLAKTGKENWEGFLSWTKDFEYEKLSLPKPDYVIYLDIPPHVSQELMSRRYKGDESQKDIYESNVEFLNSCREAALYCVKKLSWKRINCIKDSNIKTVDEIHSEIFKIVNKKLSFN